MKELKWMKLSEEREKEEKGENMSLDEKCVSCYQAVILRYVLLEVLELHLAGNSLEIIISSL